MAIGMVRRSVPLRNIEAPRRVMTRAENWWLDNLWCRFQGIRIVGLGSLSSYEAASLPKSLKCIIAELAKEYHYSNQF